MVTISWVWTQSSYQPIDPCDLPGRAAVQLFMTTLLPYEKGIFNFVQEFFCQGYKYRPSPSHFYGSPCVFHSFYVLLQMGPGFPNDNFSFPPTAVGLHRLASKVFVTAFPPLSVSSNRTLWYWVGKNDSFLLWQRLSFIDEHRHKFGIHLSKSRRLRFSIPHKIID